MSAKKRGVKNAESIYRQQLLSGWRDFGKPENWDGGSSQKKSTPKKNSRGVWKSKVHQISIPVVIEEISIDGNKHYYRISVNPYSDLPITAYSKRSKKATSQIFTIAATEGKKETEIPMVYGVSKEGVNSLSYPPGFAPLDGFAHVYSRVLVAIDRAIGRVIREQEAEKRGDDTTSSFESPSTQKGLGKPETSRGSKKIRSEIRSKNQAEEATVVNGVDGEILGVGLADK